MDIGCVIPFPREGFGFRHISEEKLFSSGAVSEVDEADDSGFSDPEHFIEEEVGSFDCLKGLAEDDEIVAVVCEIGESVIQVGLDDGDTAAGAFDHFILFLFDTHDFCLFELGEEFEESARAAAEVEDPGFSGDHGSDCFEISSGEGGIVIESDGGHSLSVSRFERKLEMSRPSVSSSRRNASCP